EKPEAELGNDVRRRGVGLGGDRDRAREAEVDEDPVDRCTARLGRDPETPPRRVERPADFGVVRPGAVELRAGAADQLTGLRPLDREEAEPVLVPVALPPVERRVALRAGLDACEMARQYGVGVPTRD